jgi:exoribonuclease-2
MELEGHIVEFLESGAHRLGYVRQREQRKIRVIDRRGRQSSIPISRVVVVHAAVSESEFQDAAEAINQRVESISTDIDIELLWEAVHREAKEGDSSDFAAAYFGEASPESTSAMFHVLTTGGLFFKRNGLRFQPRSRRQVESERLRIAREQEHEQIRRGISRLLRQAIQNGPPVNEPDWQSVSERLEVWLRKRQANEVGALLEELLGEARARETAYDLLVKSGRIHPSEDRFLLAHGISQTFPREVLEAVQRLTPYRRDPAHIDRSGSTTLAIDDDETVEIDDALTVCEEDGHTIVGIHIADVSAFVEKDDPLDREASRRSATIYLPNVSVPMFPERLSTDLASLVSGVVRPAFSVEARFDIEDRLESFRILRTSITVSERLSYECADARIAEGDPMLKLLHRVATHLNEDRVKAGSQTHRRPEIKVRVTDGRVTVHRVESDTPSRLIVSEFMILANRLAADKAAAAGTPIIFRTQEPSDVPPPQTEGLPEAIQFELLRKSFKRSRLSLSPNTHSGLGLSAYTQMSSPIRRYGDLVTQRQFVAALDGTPFPYDKEELLTIITTAEAAELVIRNLERASTNYWVLTYLAREVKDAEVSGRVVDTNGTVELTDYLVRGRVSTRTGWQMGEAVVVRIESVDPVRGEVVLREC